MRSCTLCSTTTIVDSGARKLAQKSARGDVIVRHADDLAIGFRQRADAVRFLEEFKERLAKFALELHPEQTRLIEFGRFAAHKRKQRGEGKTGNLHVLGLHPLLRARPQDRHLHRLATYAEIAS